MCALKSNNPRKEQKNYNLLMKRTIPQDEGRVGFFTLNLKSKINHCILLAAKKLSKKQ